ncbi:carbohydrate kinase family protein [Aeromonas jandaei]
MNKRGIVAIGNLLVDNSMLIESYPRERMLTEILGVELHCGGGCTNVLFDLAVLDQTLPLYLFGAVGRDANGNKIIADTLMRGINVDGVIRLDGNTSFTNVMINKNSGDRTFFHARGVMDEFSIEHVCQLPINAKIVHFAYIPLMKKFLDPDNEYPNKACKLFCELNRLGYKISVDLVSIADKLLFFNSIEPTLSYIDYLIINDEEAKLLCGVGENNETISYQELANSLLNKGVRDTVIIHYPAGAVAANRERTVSQESYWVAQNEVISTLGAGDAFCAGALYAIHEGYNLPIVLKYGSALARFNLFSMSATDGAIESSKLIEFIKSNNLVSKQ